MVTTQIYGFAHWSNALAVVKVLSNKQHIELRSCVSESNEWGMNLLRVVNSSLKQTTVVNPLNHARLVYNKAVVRSKISRDAELYF